MNPFRISLFALALPLLAGQVLPDLSDPRGWSAALGLVGLVLVGSRRDDSRVASLEAFEVSRSA